MHRVKPVFSLTKLSHVAALATLKDHEYLKESAKVSIESREFLYESIGKFENLKVYASKANYLLVDIRNTGYNAESFTEELLKRGIIVRNCSSFRGLDEYWIRVSVGTLPEDQKFIDALKEIIK